MLYPLISLFLFFQTSVSPANPALEDCVICQEQYNDISPNLGLVQSKEVEFLKAQKVLECYDEANCPPPPLLLMVLASYDVNKKTDLPRAENLLIRLDKRYDDLSDGEAYYYNLLLGNFFYTKGNYKRLIEKFKALEGELDSSQSYCQIRLEYLKQIEKGYGAQEDFKNQLVYLNKMLNLDCERNAETFLEVKLKVLNANMKLGRFENYEKQAIELKEGYLLQGDTVRTINTLSNIFEYYTERFQNKDQAFKYGKEKFDLVQVYSDANLDVKKNAFQDFIQAKLWTELPTVSADFIKYIEIRDSIFSRDTYALKNQAYLEYNSLKIDSKNKQLLLENEIIENRNRVSYFFIAFIVGFSILFIYYLYNRSSKRELRLKLEKVLARDEERNNLAKKLHDEVATDMALLSQKLRDENLRKNLLDLRGNIRGISHELSTEDFEEISFEDQIKNLMVDMMDLGVQLNPKGLNEQDWTTYSNGFKKMLYLVIKEAVVNAQTHGKAKNIDLVFDAGKKSMLLGIKDDGTGFDTETKVQGIGIRNMKKRVKEVDGLLEILSSPGNGAEFKFTLPIER